MMSIDAVRNNRLSAIDLFCGCGGLSCGVRSAGFNILAGIDLNEKYSITYRRNFPETLYLNKDIQFLAPKELLDLVNLKKVNWIYWLAVLLVKDFRKCSSKP